MQITALASMIGIWIGIVIMLASLGPRVRIRALIAFAILLIANKLIFKVDIFGSELVGNYFFSQLFAQAGLFWALAIALSLERARVPGWVRHAFLVVAILVIESAHLLPALEALICLGILVLSDLVDRWKQTLAPNRAGFFVHLIISATVLLGTAAAVIVHPTFNAMRMISENNGGLTVNRFGSLTSLVGLALIVMVSSMLLLIRWQTSLAAIKRDILPFKYFGAFGVASSALFFLQRLALHFGQGSEYACKKYAVALVSILLIQVVLHIVARRATTSDKSDDGEWPSHGLGDVVLPGIVIGLACFTVMPKNPELKVAQLRDLEVQTRQLAPLLAGRNPALPTIAVHLPAMNVMLDYMYTIAVFKAARNDMVMHLLANQGPKHFNELGAIVTARNDATYDDKACRLPFETAGLVAIDAACHDRAQQTASLCRTDFDFTKAGAVNPSMLTGFSEAEEGGTWTESRNASFKCEWPSSAGFKATHVDIVTSAFIYGDRQQRAMVSSNAAGASETTKFAHPGEVQTITLPLVESRPGLLTIDFALPDAISPKEAGMSVDGRQLGLQIKAIHFR
ncbi:hypothetical protein [Caballeronia sp. SBC2]|uniref:hypothetical protein n=1 Tax=Caballeronia sp. SBC2 TaxID=2705547 RepID=UPI0013EA3874|nr:hypothetical protein [Caballeronia sp. SBC2]